MKAGTILKLAGQNYINGLPAHLREGAIKQLNVVVQTADAFNADLATAESNPDLSVDGRAATRARVAASALATLAAIDATIKTLTERAASLEQSLLAKVTCTPPTDPTERISHELRLQEIRSVLCQLPMAERAHLYRQTVDPMIIAAIDTATVTLSATRLDGAKRLEPFIDPAERTAAALLRAEAADPATAQSLREIRSLREVYSHAVSSVRSEINKEVSGGVPLPATA